MRQFFFVLITSFVADALLVATISDAQAAWLEVDNFEDGYSSHPFELDGNASNSNGWEEGKHVTSGNEQIARVVNNPAGGTNRVLEIGLNGDSGDRDFHKNAQIPNNATGTLFFRFYMTGDEPTLGVGMDDQPLETVVSETGPWVNVSLNEGVRGITVDGNGSADTQEVLAPLTKNVWYSVWMAIDNSAKEYDLYIQGGAFASQTHLSASTTLVFRDSLSVDANLSRVYIRPNGDMDDGDGASVFVDDVYLENTTIDLSLPSSVSLEFPVPVVEANRTDGSLTLRNLNSPGADLSIRGYSITSASGALRATSANWKSIANNYDSDSGGEVDSNDTWTILTDPEIDGSNDLSEYQVLPGDGGIVTNGSDVVLSQGVGAWIPTPAEDLVAEIALSNGDVITVPVIYTGNNDETLLYGDLNHDGNITGADWIVFRTHDLTDVSGFSDALRYALGDVFPIDDPDGVIDTKDFVQFKAYYEAANGSGSFALMLQSVPEPSSLLLLALGGFFFVVFRRKSFMKKRNDIMHLNNPLLIVFVCVLAWAFCHVDAKAIWIELDDFEDGYSSHPYQLDGIAANSNGWEDGKHTGGTDQIAQVVDDPAGGTNRVLEIGFIGSSPDRDFHKDAFIANDATGTLFFRFYMTGAEPSLGVGMDDQLHESQPNESGPWVNMTWNNGLRGVTADNNGSTDTQENLAEPLSQEVWYSVWMVIDNAAKEYEVYLQGGAFTSQTQVTPDSNNTLVFRDSLSVDDDLIRLYVRPNGDNDDNGGASVFLDDFFLNSSEANLDLPEDQSFKAIVHPLTGEILLANKYAATFDIDSYQIDSPLGALRTGDEFWESLDDKGYDANGSGTGESWDEAGGSNATSIAERYLLGSSVFGPGESVSIGRAYDPGLGDGNMTLTYNEATLGVATSLVEFALLGDMNDDGDVNATDVPLFIQALTNRAAFEANPNATTLDADFIGDLDGNGLLDTGDIAAFSLAVQAAGSAESSAVPEPTAVVLAGLMTAGLMLRRTRRATALSANRTWQRRSRYAQSNLT